MGRPPWKRYPREEAARVHHKFLGLYPNDEVYYMSKAVEKELEKEEADKTANMHLPVERPKNALANKAIEEVLCNLTEPELHLFYDIVELLDREYEDEIPDVEILFLALEYIKYLRWITYSLTTPPDIMRQAQVQYEKTIGDKMMNIFTRLDRLRHERVERKEKVVDFVVERLPEGQVEVKKVKYVTGKGQVTEEKSDTGPEKSD